MLLRRVIDHMKAQNWTAVTLDFVVVVLGVFIGFQASNWNDERLELQKAYAFDDRLIADMRAEAVLYGDTETYYRSVLHNAEATLLALTDEKELEDDQLLVSAFRATQFFWYSRRRAAYDELEATGDLNLIFDDQLRETAILYYNADFIDNMSKNSENSLYKIEFGKTAPPKVHQQLRERCGGRALAEENYADRGVTIEYECALDLSAEDIAEAVAALKQNDALAPALRLRIADVSTAIANLAENKRLFDFLREYDW